MNLPDDGIMDALVDPRTGDLVVSGDDIQVSGGLQAIAQECRARFETWRGEWFLNPAEGLPMVERVVQKGVPLSEIQVVFRKALDLIPGVIEVVSLSVQYGDRARREAMVLFQAKTTAGLLTSTDFPPFVVPL